MNAIQATGASGDYTWLIIIAAVGAIIGIAFFLHRRYPSQTAKVTADAQAGATELANKLADLLHKKEDTSAQLAAVVISPPVQAVLNAPKVAASPAIAVVGAVPLPTGAPMIPVLYQGTVRHEDFVYPDEPDYKKTGNEPPWGWVPVLRTQMGLSRVDRGNVNYHEGDTIPGPVASEAQASLLRIFRDSAQPQGVRDAAAHGLIDSLGFPGDNANAGTPANQALARLLAANPQN